MTNLLRKGSECVFRQSRIDSKRLGDFPGLGQARLRVPVFLPADRKHRVASLARRHDDSELVARRREVVVRLVAQRYLWSWCTSVSGQLAALHEL